MNPARRSTVALFVVLLTADVSSALPPLPPQPPGVEWPTKAWTETAPGPDVDRNRLQAALDTAFVDVGRGGLPDTRAFLVVHHGAIVAERYAPGYGPDIPLPSRSMAKSVTQALVGILVREGRLDVNARAEIPEWQQANDPRRKITLDNLLHMTAGLDDADDIAYAPESRAMRMLYGEGSGDVAAFAASAPPLHPPGTHWAYSTPSSMLVASIIGRTVGGGRKGMLTFMRQELFGPLGMKSAVPEFDAAGTFLGGSYVDASARDWARFGYLYLRDGTWDGRRILSAGWVDYARTPAPAPDNGTYGAHFWLNRAPRESQFPVLPGAPPSAFCASGFAGQEVVIVPTHDLVVVRLGEMQTTSWPKVTAGIARVIEAFPPVAGAEK